MDKKIVVLVHPGMPYRKTIKYGCVRAREMGAKLTLLAIVSELDGEDQIGMAVHEIAPYATLSRTRENETVDFLERAVQYCLDSNVTVQSRVERGSLEEAIKRIAEEADIKLIVMPTPTRKEHHSSFLHTISQFAHEMLDYDLKCPVVSVVAA